MRFSTGKRIASAVCAIAMLVSSVCSRHIMPTSASVESTVTEQNLCQQSFELHLNDSEDDQIITLEGLMPKGASVEAADVSEDYDGIAAYDITITDGSREFQPDERNPILVEIFDAVITEDEPLELWHIQDNGLREQITDFTAEDGKISFYAAGFSVYEIVVDEDLQPTGGESSTLTLVTKDTFSTYSSKGVLIYQNVNGYYLTDNTFTDKSPKGIEATKDVSKAAKYYFESAANGNYRVYCMKGGQKYYLKKSDSDLLLTTDKTAANANLAMNADFNKLKASGGKTLGLRNGYFVASEDNTIYLYYPEPSQSGEGGDQLDGKTYGLMNYTGGTHGYALMADQTGKNVHSLIQLVTHQTATTNSVTLYVDESSEVTMWEFHADGNGQYTLSAATSSGTQYLTVSSDRLLLTDSADSAALFTVTPDSKGRIQLFTDGKYVTFSVIEDEQSTATAFGLSSLSSENTWLSLLNTAQLSDSDTITYSAERISVSAAENGQKVIVYTRIWNETSKRYDMYAVDYNGTLYPCYASGGKILWLGDGTTSLEWKFIEHYDAVTKEPNYYYELYNPYSEKYIAPQITNNQVLSDSEIGINMQGRRNNEFYSEIIAWDSACYNYIGLKPNEDNTRLIPCSQATCVPFYFATLETLKPSESLTEVRTIDNNEYGIKVKMQDFSSRSAMSSYLGNDDSSDANLLNEKPGLLSTNLVNGYPTFTDSKSTHIGESLSKLYNNLTTVNHLFIESVYNSSGYFEFDSCQNFATLCNDDGTLKSTYDYVDANGNHIPTLDFTVYRELGTSDNSTVATRKHGQFFPYDNIVGKPLSEKHRNIYSSITNQKGEFGELPEWDPRKYEVLYNVGNNSGKNSAPNYYNGMELEATFVQTVSGLDAWGHDIIFEFTGDDDFWLYVDDELVIDLGGIHSALEASVNFRTGEVIVNKKPATTLKQIFIDNYTTRYQNEHSGAAPSDDEIQTYLLQYFQPDSTKPYGVEDIFADYSTHTMKIFYMERGAGASNLHMRFNLASVKPGHVVVSKEVSGDDKDALDTDFIEYPFQIYYIAEDENGNRSEKQLLKNDNTHIRVTYQNSNQPVTFVPFYRPPGFTEAEAYQNIYFINPTKDAEISFPDGTIEYQIVECAVDSTVYKEVLINGERVPEDRISVNRELRSYSSELVSAENRPTISFDNVMADDVIKDLRITKRLYDKNNAEIKDDPATFSFRLSLSSVIVPADSIPRANMYRYYVLSENDMLCRHNNSSADGGFIETELEYSTENIRKVERGEVEGLSLSDIEFHTSGFGAISGIPSGYTICVPGLPVGTLFKVTEDVKTGYGIDSYQCIMGEKRNNDGTVEFVPSYLPYENNPQNVGRIIAGHTPQMEVRNKKGYGFTVQKRWSDLDLTTAHDPVYVAVYVDGKLLEGSVKEIVSPSTTAYYFWESLVKNADGTVRADFDGYEVREVKLSGTVTADSDGNVTHYDKLTPLNPGDSIALSATRTAAATPSGESRDKEFNYIVSYAQGEQDGASRTDTITNTREGGISVRLFKWGTAEPLAGGRFTLKDSSGKTLGTYTSDAEGIVTILYDFQHNAQYSLVQNTAPKGYVGLQKELRFQINDDDSAALYYADGTSAWGSEAAADNHWANWKNGTGGITAFVDIYNKPFHFVIMKTDSLDPEKTLDSAHFALYKQVNTPISGYVKNKDPMTGFEDMVTVNGTVDVCGGTSGRQIDPGTNGSVYFLTEIQAPFNYNKLNEDIIFRISPLGEPSLISDSYNGRLVEEQDTYVYTLSVPNTQADPDLTLLTVKKQVRGSYGDKNKAFGFTFAVSGADSEDEFIWAKNGELQTAPLHSGDMFTLKNSEMIEISLTSGAEVTITEENENYTTTFKLDDAAPKQGNSMTFTIDESAYLLVTNTLHGNIITGLSSAFGKSIALTVIPAFSLGLMLYRRRKRKLQAK